MPGDPRQEAARPPWFAAVGTITFAPLFAGSVIVLGPYLLSGRRAVLRLGSVEMDWRRARDLPHSSAPRFSGALRARGTRDAGTLRPTPAPRRQWTVPIRAQSGVPLRRVHDRRTGAFPRQHARAGLRGRRGTRLPPLRGPLRGAHAARDVRCGLRGLLRRGASVGSAPHPWDSGWRPLGLDLTAVVETVVHHASTHSATTHTSRAPAAELGCDPKTLRSRLGRGEAVRIPDAPP